MNKSSQTGLRMGRQEREGVKFLKNFRNRKPRMARVRWELIPRVGKHVHTGSCTGYQSPGGSTGRPGVTVQDAGHSRVQEEPCLLAPREINATQERKTHTLYKYQHSIHTTLHGHLRQLVPERSFSGHDFEHFNIPLTLWPPFLTSESCCPGR